MAAISGLPFESFALFWQKFINHSRATFNKLWSKSYVCQIKTKCMWKCVKWELSTGLMCRPGVGNLYYHGLHELRIITKILMRAISNVHAGRRFPTPGLDKEQFKIKWLQTIYNMKWTSTQKQIHIQNEKFNLRRAIQFCIACIKYRVPFWEFALGT